MEKALLDLGPYFAQQHGTPTISYWHPSKVCRYILPNKIDGTFHPQSLGRCQEGNSQLNRLYSRQHHHRSSPRHQYSPSNSTPFTGNFLSISPRSSYVANDVSSFNSAAKHHDYKRKSSGSAEDFLDEVLIVMAEPRSTSGHCLEGRGQRLRT